MIDDVFINKAAIIGRCISRINEEFREDLQRLNNYTIQDSITVNLLRACEAVIDLAMHACAQNSLEIPQSSRDGFILTRKKGLISSTSAINMKCMCGFRNIAVHSYREIKMPLLEAILLNHIIDFETFLNELRER